MFMEYFDDIYKVLFEEQVGSSLNAFFHYLTLLQHQFINDPADFLTQKWKERCDILPWLRSLSCNIPDETYFIAVGYFDRCLARADIPEEKLHVIAYTCLMVACKVSYTQVTCCKDFSSFSKGSYTKKQLSRYERDLLSCLDWRCQWTSPTRFLERLAIVIGYDTKAYDLALWFLWENLKHPLIVAQTASFQAAFAYWSALKHMQLDPECVRSFISARSISNAFTL
jgi:hypothetical protein